MAKRVKLTVFSRFLIVMLFIVPLAYMGASYYNGEDGVQNLKKLLGIEESASIITSNKKDLPSGSKDNNVITRTKHENTGNDSLESRISKLEEENRSLKEEILRLKTEVAQLKSN